MRRTARSYSTLRPSRAARSVCAAVALIAFTGTTMAETVQPGIPAKQLFGTRTLPAAMAPASHGFYSKGCLAGGQAIAVDGDNWQAMRLNRNRRWGHPDTIALVERLADDTKRDGRNGILVGDLSQPRGGPMLTGHASHQIGLDADIWLRDMPTTRFTFKERENESAISVLKPNTRTLNPNVWTDGHFNLIKRAASYPEVQRVLVHPAIKQQMCKQAGANREWLGKVRPYYGHHYHMHVRLHCPAGSPGCKPQKPVPAGDGCGQQLAWWLSDAPWAPPPKKTTTKVVKPKPNSKPTVPKFKRLADLPQACRGVLLAPSANSEASATRGGEARAYATATAKRWLAKANENAAREVAVSDVGLPRFAPAPKARP